MQNYPNPFNPSTSITYKLPSESYVKLNVYDMSGREVARLVDGIKEKGSHIIVFNASSLSSGIYIYKIDAGEFSSVKKMTLLK